MRLNRAFEGISAPRPCSRARGYPTDRHFPLKFFFRGTLRTRRLVLDRGPTREYTCPMNSAETSLQDLFGVRYYQPGAQAVQEAHPDDLYFYQAFVGTHTISVERGDCVYYVSDDLSSAHLRRGPLKVESTRWAVVVRGYMPENKSSEILTRTNLPYVNGCSTKQVFAPERPGDPTLQILNIPPHSSEQVHHVHSTVRVVHVLKGEGVSVVGMDARHAREELHPGKTVILEKFSPHHFETGEQGLTVLPLHVFSSVPSEFSHPMFHGTHRTDFA